MHFCIRYAMLAAALAFAVPGSADAGWLVKRKLRPSQAGTSIEILGVSQITLEPEAKGRGAVLGEFPLFLEENAPASTARFDEVLYAEESLPAEAREFLAREKALQPLEDLEVRTIVEQGAPANRIDLAIVGDGYTLAEKEKFFQDAKRLTQGLFTGSTFASYLPLFNVHAIFVASRQSGITDGANRRDTAFGLYRSPAGSKRGIMPGNTIALERALARAPGADYPIVVANDDYYGGLGGRYAITTRSVETGLIVLRHELGHNFGQVGEEYDSGSVYSGANSSSSSRVPWTHWIEGSTSVYDSLYLSGDYVWQKLDRPYSTSFTFPSAVAAGEYSFELQLSSVGWATPEDVHVYLDGLRLELEGHYTADRSFFKALSLSTPAPGRHTLEVRQNIADGDNLLAFAEVHAVAPGVDPSLDHVGAYATYNESGQKFYRPTHGSCLMREMDSPDFCAIDKENMWVQFFKRVRLIDDLRVSGRSVVLATPPLEGLTVRWFRLDDQSRETELTEFAGRSRWNAPEALRGRFRVKVQYRTTEVRKYSAGFDDSRDFGI